MFIAHIPAGYIIANWYHRQGSAKLSPKITSLALSAILLGSVLPDFDLLYFYCFDGRQHNHHTYFPHLPSFWIAVFFPILAISCILKKRNFTYIAAGFALGILSHLMLDSIVGGIAWLHPFSDQLYHLTKVPARQGWWVWSFFLHWTFTLELIVCFWAGCLWMKKRSSTNQQNHGNQA